MKDEEYEEHQFIARLPRDKDDIDQEGPIWCDGCDYHRDHAIHVKPGEIDSLLKNYERQSS